MKNLCFVIVTIVVVSLSCKKDEALTHATIIDGGAMSVDGCGWLLETDDAIYSPANLDSEFMINNLEVLVSFEASDDSLICGIGANISYPLINIEEMKKH